MWVSGGEIAFIGFAGLIAFGPKDIPKIARAAGKMSGQAMGFLFAARDRVHQMADKAELIQLHSEVRQTLAQLQAVCQEALHGVQIPRPDPVPWAARPDWPTPGQPATQPGTQSGTKPGTQSGTQPGTQPGEQPGTQASTQLGQECSSFRASPMEPRSMTAVAAQQSRLEGDMVWRSVGDVAGASVGGSSSGAGAGNQGPPDGMSQSLYTLPVSAASAGLLPKRQGALTGSDILCDALLEEQVAEGAQHFLRRNTIVQDSEKGA